MSNRREFLKFLAASPLLGALPAGVPGFAQALAQAGDFIISNPAEALNVFEFEAAARKVLPPGALGLHGVGRRQRRIAAGQSAGVIPTTRSAPAGSWTSAASTCRPQLFGTTWETPIVLCPIGSCKIAEPER